MKRPSRAVAGIAVILAAGALTTASLGTPTRHHADGVRWTIVYTEVGGIAGLDDRLVITSTGSAVLTRRMGTRTVLSRATVPASTRAKLMQLLQRAYAVGLKSHYKYPGVIMDGIDQSVTFRGVTVRVDQDGNPPNELSVALSALYEVSAKLGSSAIGTTTVSA